MSSAELENLAKIGKLKREPPSAPELRGLHKSATARLADAVRGELSYESRFDLAYNAAHGLALYALRRLGYRSDNLEHDERLLSELVTAAKRLRDAVEALPSPGNFRN